MNISARMAPLIEVRPAPPRMLIIDDAGEFVEKASEFFTGLGFEVETVPTPEAAEKLLKDGNTYHIILADVNFGRLSKTTGDDFVMDNRHLFGEAKCVVISAGEWLTKEKREQLEATGILFREKTKLEDSVIQISQEENERWAKDVQQVLETETMPRIQRMIETETIPRIEGLTGGKVTIEVTGGAAVATAPVAEVPVTRPGPRELVESLMPRLKQSLIRWLETRKDRDLRVYAYGDKVYSANNLIEEIETDSPVGFEHLMMLYTQFEYYIHTPDRGTTHDDETE